MLILAGVTVNVAINGGLFEYAGNAKHITEDASEKESIQKAVVIAKGQSKTGRITVEEMQKALNKVINEGAATAINNGDTIAVKFEQSGIYYNIDADGKLEQFTPYEDTTPGQLSQNSDGEYMIESIEDLVVFSAMVNGGYSDENLNISKNNSIKAVLMCDLDFKSSLSYDDYTTTIYNGYLGIEDEDVTLMEALTNTEEYQGFIPIGNDASNFSGTFDGKNHYINNLCENTDTYAGLFGDIWEATIQNITITGEIESTTCAAGIIGYIGGDSIIANCTNYVNVIGSSAGGIVGRRYGASGTPDISFCVNYGKIEGSYAASGIMGFDELGPFVKFNYCINSGNVSGGTYAAGILGAKKSGEVYFNSCLNSVEAVVISNDSKGYAGGIVGAKTNNINFYLYNCANLGKVSGYYCGRYIG